jgi:hypothetical protein
MTNTTERKMITGTEGNPDYLVIAKQDGFELGLKPLVLIGIDQSQYGFRLRLVKGEHADIENEKQNLETMQHVFAEIPWSKRSGTRFSTVLLNECAYGIEFLNKVREQAKQGAQTLVAAVIEKVEPVELFDTLDTMAFVEETYDSILDEIEVEFSKYKAEQQQSTKSQIVADVLAFPTGSKSKATESDDDN